MGQAVAGKALTAGVFTLEAGRWLAAEFIGEEFGAELRSFSPIRIDHVKPLKTGSGLLELGFLHASYPQGVQDKVYRLQVLERNARFILARCLDHQPARYLLVHDIDRAWLQGHFPRLEVPEHADLQAWLARNTG